MGSDSGDEEKITAMVTIGKTYDTITSASSNIKQKNEGKRIELFYIRVTSKHTKIDTLFNTGSQENLISESLVKQLGLKTHNHPNPYPLGWLKEQIQIHVTKQCRLKFAITANYIDEVELDVISLDICGIVLGSPYLYDRDAVFYRKEHMYHLIKYEIKYIVRAHKNKDHLNLINANQMKRLVSSSRRYILMSIKEQHKDLIDTCSGCEI